MKNLLALLLLCSTAYASPVLLDSQTVNNGDGTQTFVSQSGGWWQDDSGDVQRTDSSLRQSDGVWDVENTSAPHKVYAATDEVRWRVDPPAGEAAGFEIAFATVSLYMFDEVNGDVEKTINWSRAPLTTTYDGATITFPLFNGVSLYVISTPEGYKSNFFISNPAQIPDPSSNDYFGASVELSQVYFAVRYSVSKWPDSPMSVDGVEYGPGAIVDGYSAEFGDDLWMLPTKAYRNVKDFDGQSFHGADDESYVYYIFDRLSQEILVLAPYTLFVGADNVVIDPTTWTSGRTSSDDASWTASNAATSNFSTDDYVDIGYNSSTERHGLFRFASIPSVPNVTNVSATLILFYQSQYNTNTIPIYVTRLLRDWVESEVTFNVFSTGNSWGTAGANNSSTDYDGSNIISYSWTNASNLVLDNTTPLNLLCESWMEGTVTNNGINIFRNGSTTTEGRAVSSDDHATGGLRPYLAITYTSASSLASLSDDAISVDVFPGSIVASITILDATTASVFIADLIPDVSLDLVLEDTTHLVVGAGADADENWDAYTAVDLIGGGSMFVLVSNYDLTQAAACALYFDSSLTGYTDTRSFGLSPAGGGSSETGIADRIDSATALLVTRFDTVDSSITNASTAIQAQLDDVETTQSSHTSTLSDVSTRMKAVEADAVWTVFTNTLINGATSTHNASPGYCYVPAGYPVGYAKQSTVGGATDTLKFVFLSWVNMGSETEAVYTPAAKFEVDYGAWTVVGDIVTSATEGDVVRGTLQSTDILQYATGKF